jgi:pimeloyl-ACP methyl ester carboxylesterase
LVFLHGACVDHHSFDSILPVIAEHYHLVTLDNPDFISNKILEFLRKTLQAK